MLASLLRCRHPVTGSWRRLPELWQLANCWGLGVKGGLKSGTQAGAKLLIFGAERASGRVAMRERGAGLGFVAEREQPAHYGGRRPRNYASRPHLDVISLAKSGYAPANRGRPRAIRPIARSKARVAGRAPRPLPSPAHGPLIMQTMLFGWLTVPMEATASGASRVSRAPIARPIRPKTALGSP